MGSLEVINSTQGDLSDFLWGELEKRKTELECDAVNSLAEEKTD